MAKIELNENAKVNIKWPIRSVDYSREKAENIAHKFAAKYNIPRKNVRVIPVFITKKEGTDDIIATSDIVANIQDSKFQQQLFKQYIKEKEIELTDDDFDQIIKIDDEINGLVKYEKYESYRKYTIKWLKWDNFMSYGKDNYFDFSDLHGLVLLNSEPANQGGKTTFCIDLLRFLLFGKVTSRESDWTLAKVFNKHLEKETECKVEGCIVIDGVEYVIRRVVTRVAANKRTDKSKVSQKVQYYRLVNDEYLELMDEANEQGVSVTETNKIIKEAIGNEKDFDLMICVDSDNLKSLISLKDADRGRLISRWIGLLPLEEKDKLARETYNHKVLPGLMLNKYNKVELSNTNDLLLNDNEQYKKNLQEYQKKIEDSNKLIETYNKQRDALLSSKQNIDESLKNVDVESIKNENEKIKNDGIIKNQHLTELRQQFASVKDVDFDKAIYESKKNEESNLKVDLETKRNDFKTITTNIDALQKGEYCPTCGAKLQGVDNTAKINEQIQLRDKLTKEALVVKQRLETLNNELSQMKTDSDKYDLKNRLDLSIAKAEVELEKMRNKYRDNAQTLKDVENNISAIQKNNQIEQSLNLVDTNIQTEKDLISTNTQSVNELNDTIRDNTKTINDNVKLITRIEIEEKIVAAWKLYLDMIGRNGISKLVLRNVLPLINGELKSLLSDVCDFEVEVSIDEHNDVAFSMLHDGVYSNLASGSGFEQTVSSLALRSVLSKISTFSKPSFVVFDEILGGVAEENYDQVKGLYDKIVKDYQMILYITHNYAHKEWATKTILIQKENNISTIKSVK